MRWCSFGVGLAVASGFAAAQPLATGPAVRVDGHKVVRVEVRSVSDLRLMDAVGADQWSHSIRPGVPADFMASPEALAALDEAGVRYGVVVEDVQALIDAENERLRGGGKRAWFDDFRTLAEIDAYMGTLAAQRPDIASVFEVGQSIEGRMVRGLRIANDSFGDPACKPTILFNACQHSREWISPMVAMFTADRLVAAHGSDPDLTALIDRAEILIVPVVNPDGYQYTWTTYRLWRKNRRNNGNGTFGVDLNRNWGVGWGLNNGSSGSGSSETYRGTAPFSEPETDVVRALAESRPRLAAHVDLHSYGQLLLAPWGYTIDLPPGHETFQMLGAEMQQIIKSVHGRTYVHGPTYTALYPISGGGDGLVLGRPRGAQFPVRVARERLHPPAGGDHPQRRGDLPGPCPPRPVGAPGREAARRLQRRREREHAGRARVPQRLRRAGRRRGHERRRRREHARRARVPQRMGGRVLISP